MGGESRVQKQGRAHNNNKSYLSPWLKDTGSTYHSTNDRRLLTNYRALLRPVQITYGDGKHEGAPGVGTVHLRVQDVTGNVQCMTLHNVLYLPRSGGNIFSSQYFIGGPDRRTGNRYAAGPEGTFTKQKEQQRVKLDEARGLAYLRPLGITTVAQSNVQRETKRPSYPSTDARYWHMVLGHASAAKLLQLQRLGMVKGMPKRFTSGLDALRTCPICITCKGRRHSNISNDRTPARHAFDMVSTDLAEMNVRSRKGSCKWAVIYVDHYTRMKWVYGIKRKSDTYLTLAHFVERVVHANKHELGTIMCDNGGEFLSQDYLATVSAARATIRYAPPVTQSSNGIAERAVGSLVRMTRALLKHAHAPATWWLWAMKHACYVQNRLTTKGLGNGDETETPYERMHGEAPGYAHMRPFGCKMYMHVYAHNRSELDDTYRETTFLGYPELHSDTTYIGWDHSAQREYVSTHVHFDHSDLKGAAQDASVASDSGQLNYKRNDGAIWATDTCNDKMLALALRSDPFERDDAPGVPRSPTRSPRARPDDSDDLPTPADSHDPESTRISMERESKGVSDLEQSADTHSTLSTPSSPSAPSPCDESAPCPTEQGDATPPRRSERLRELQQKEEQGRVEKVTNKYGTPDTAVWREKGITDDRIPARAAAISGLEGIGSGRDSPAIKPEQAETMIKGLLKTATTRKHSCNCCGATGLTRKDRHDLNEGWYGRSDLPTTSLFPGLCYATFNSLDIRIPQTRREALSGNDAKEWMRAEREEMGSMLTNHVYTPIKLTDVPKGANICDSRFVYDVKTHADGTLEKYKVRWVAKGFSQRKGKDYWETFSPVVRMSSVRTLLSIATAAGLQVRQCDIKTAFLEADLEEEIYVRPPEGYEGEVYKLHRALYGLKQSSREFNKLLTSVLRELGYHPLRSDTCILRKVKRGANGKAKVTLVGAYVDDLIITGNDNEEIEAVVQGLQQRFRVKDLGALRQILGCHWERRSDGTSIFKQTKTINDIVNRFKLSHLPAVSTPAVVGERMDATWSPKVGSDEHRKMNASPVKKRQRGIKEVIKVEHMSLTTQFRAIVGSLLWIGRCTRPDIMHVVSELSRAMQNPGERHLKRAIRVVQYLKGTKDRGIVWHRRAGKFKANQLYTFSDASFADRANAKSSYGYLTCLNGGPVDYASKGQLDVAQSTCEAEYVAMSKAIVSAIAMSQLLQEMQLPQETVQVFCDNTAALAISQEDKAHMRTRAIKVRYHHIRDEIASKQVSVHYLKTDEMPADLMTKNLAPKPFVYLRNKVTGI